MGKHIFCILCTFCILCVFGCQGIETPGEPVIEHVGDPYPEVWMEGRPEEREVFTEQRIKAAIRRLGWGEYFHSLDREYQAYTLADIYVYNLLDTLDQLTASVCFDCDNFDLTYLGRALLLLPCAPIGMICYEWHCQILFYDYYNDKLWTIDAQTDTFGLPDRNWRIQFIII